MPLIILGLLVIAGLFAYLYFTKASPDEIEELIPNKPKEAPKAQEDDTPRVTVLPTDIEKEKKKRGIKTGK